VFEQLSSAYVVCALIFKKAACKKMLKLTIGELPNWRKRLVND